MRLELILAFPVVAALVLSFPESVPDPGEFRLYLRNRWWTGMINALRLGQVRIGMGSKITVLKTRIEGILVPYQAVRQEFPTVRKRSGQQYLLEALLDHLVVVDSTAFPKQGQFSWCPTVPCVLGSNVYFNSYH